MTDILGLNSIIQFFVQRYDRNSVPIQERLQSLISQNEVLIANQKQQTALLGEIMSRIDEQSAAVQAKIDAQTAQQNKALREIKLKLNELSTVQITPEERDAAVAAAKEAQQIADKAEFDAAIEAAFAPINQKLDAAAPIVQELDDLVTDAVPQPQSE